MAHGKASQCPSPADWRTVAPAHQCPTPPHPHCHPTAPQLPGPSSLTVQSKSSSCCAPTFRKPSWIAPPLHLAPESSAGPLASLLLSPAQQIAVLSALIIRPLPFPPKQKEPQLLKTLQISLFVPPRDSIPPTSAEHFHSCHITANTENLPESPKFQIHC